MDVQQVLDKARDTITVGRVYGQPIEKDGVTLVPAAAVAGGGGGGSGADEAGGGGFGVQARPVGAFVIKDGRVHWEPAVDVNRLALGGMVVAVIALLTLRLWIKRRRR